MSGRIPSPRLFVFVILALSVAVYPPAAESQEPSRPTIGVVLSGGGALGFAHVGVLRVLEDVGIPVDIVVGTSMGSIIGGLLAAGYTPEQMRRITAETEWPRLFTDARERRQVPLEERRWSERSIAAATISADGVSLPGGVIAGKAIVQYLYGLTNHSLAVHDFDDLPVRYRAVATDIATGERVVLGTGSLAEAMRASSGIPGVFMPLQLDGRYVVDGGVVDNLPVDVARDLGADIVIAVDVVQLSDQPVQRGSALDAVYQSIRLLLLTSTKEQREAADLVIAPDLGGFTSVDYTRAAAIMQQGEEAARAELEDLRLLARRVFGASEAGGEGPPRRQEAPPASNRPARFGDRASRVQIDGVEFRGNERYAHRQLRSWLGRLSGRSISVEDLDAAVNRLYEEGRFELLHYHAIPDGEGSTLQVVVQEADPAELRLGLRHRSHPLAAKPAEVIASADLIVWNPIGLRSRFWAHLSMIDETRIDAAVSFPFAEVAALELYGFGRDTTEYVIQNAPGATAVDVSQAGAGFGLAVAPTPPVSVAAQVEGRWAVVGPWEPSVVEPYNGIEGVLGLHLELDNLDFFVMPTHGVGVTLRGLLCPPLVTTQTGFLLASATARWQVPLSAAWSLGLRATAYTDFGWLLPAYGFDSLPFHRSVAFGGWQRFAGYVRDAFRSNEGAVAGASARRRVLTFAEEVGGNVDVVVRGNVGTVRSEHVRWDGSHRFRWGVGAGIQAAVARFAASATAARGDGGRLVLTFHVATMAR
jgi:NTE family protein